MTNDKDLQEQYKKLEETVTIPKVWLETLQALAEKCSNEKDKIGMWMLIGYIDSVKVILKMK